MWKEEGSLAAAQLTLANASSMSRANTSLMSLLLHKQREAVWLSQGQGQGQRSGVRVSTSKSWSGCCHLPGQGIFVHTGIQFERPQVNFKDGGTTFNVWWT